MINILSSWTLVGYMVVNILILGCVKCDINWNGNNWAMSCDFRGSDLSSVLIASQFCGGKCAQTQGCTHFTWTQYSGGTCWMKSGTVSKSDAVSTSDPTMVCGVMDGGQQSSIQWNGNNWAMSCDFRGNDLSNVQIASNLCGGKCSQTQGCTHFTWTQYNGGTCWMKSGAVSKSDAVSTSDSTMVCGVVVGGPIGQASGFTTRYWDCCKPSCAWPGKVSGSNTYVKSCQKDGYTSWNDGNTLSGCDGGNAFVCNNQIPWAINDQLAYGFAAATIPGLTEQQRCCACYKLDFTSGPVVGKSMIVQVVNSGSDVHPNQFDLQIPGGGVGIYNACSSQWNAPSDGWGQRLGGVSSRQDCYSLPAAIRDG
ncbi:unnamed protein product, partial [Rotaria sp. Silwood2]